jgi:Ca2+-binding EF-hand superfamily protein
MKKLLMLGAAVLTFQAAPVLADSYGGEGDKKGKLFETHDTNGDGVISKSEFLAHMEKKAEERFSKMDKDGDGSISKEEAKANKEARKEKMKEKRDKWKEKRKEKMQEKQSEM